MDSNEHFDPSKRPAKWETLWTADFRKLLDVYPPETVEDLMAYSQSDSQREYNWNCKAFCGNCGRNFKFMEATKKTSKWKPMWERYASIVNTGNLLSEDEIEFLDSETDPDFTAEQFERMDGLEGLGYKKHPNPNTLCTMCGEPWISCSCDDDPV